MKNQDVVNLFKFIVQEVERLDELRRTDREKSVEETRLDRGLPLNYDDFCQEYRECGKAASGQLYEMAVAKLQEMAGLNERVKVQTFLKPIKVELARRALLKREKIDESFVKSIFHEAESRAKSVLEDRLYFFPVYTLAVNDVQEYEFGPARFIQREKFFADYGDMLKKSEDLDVKGAATSSNPGNSNFAKEHVAKLFRLAREHYGSYRWIACIEIKGAEPSIGRNRAREILELSLGLLRLSVPSSRGQFIGLIDEYPELRSASHLSLKATGKFETWHSVSYAEPHTTPGFIKEYRQRVPQIENLEIAIRKLQQWEQPNEIEERLLASIFWFSESWKEDRLVAKIVKYSICVESLFSTSGDHEALAEKISERLAWLSFPSHADWQARRDTYQAMKAVYAARSKVVHGDTTAKERKLSKLAHQAEEQASLGLFAFSQLPPFFKDKKDKEKLLNEFFIRLKLEGPNRAFQTFQNVDV